MKIINIIIIALVSLLSIAAGLAKVMAVPEEVEFLQGVGFDGTSIFVYGAIQVIGGLLTVMPKTRVIGAVTVMLGFMLSTVFIFVSGNVPFGFISILPIALAALVAMQALKKAPIQVSS